MERYEIEREAAEILEQAREIAEEYGEDLFDTIHDLINGHKWVIYYSKAWKVARHWDNFGVEYNDLVLPKEGNLDALIGRVAFMVLLHAVEEQI